MYYMFYVLCFIPPFLFEKIQMEIYNPSNHYHQFPKVISTTSFSGRFFFSIFPFQTKQFTPKIPLNALTMTVSIWRICHWLNIASRCSKQCSRLRFRISSSSFTAFNQCLKHLLQLTENNNNKKTQQKRPSKKHSQRRREREKK